MSLSELIAGVEAHEQTLTVFNAGASVTDDLRDRFADRNVRVVRETTGSGRPGEFLTLSDDDGVYAATDVESFYDSLEDRERVLGEDAAHSVLDHLDETLFTSWSIGRMVAASREIEDRAWRVGEGALHAGFQTLSTLEGELDLYEGLGDSPVDVHAYAVPDIDPPAHTTFQLHLDRSAELANSWFVVFDDGVDEEATTQKCALLAEEREPREFYGFWTYDPSTVDYIVDHLETRYGMLEQ
ncbi:DICT sensory domain-containing protein [Haloarcula onubensis]|uniref:Histidine kinase n=1 Tax=Haloarcula onubensis TaxID=2950539 RepID=A0ABU2FQD0_9EURY|nr:DICT sensory domain-containing protein [Halomicroarcula sp. S3CR25-11]MDS0282954.1 histidine kinase [Halomicroarcula sp. S3CR25-11]